MKIRYAIGSLAVAGIFGAGIYFAEDAKSLFNDGKRKAEQALGLEQTDNSSSETAPGTGAYAQKKEERKRDVPKSKEQVLQDRSEKIEQLLTELVGELKDAGTESAQQAYQGTKTSLYLALDRAKQEICQCPTLELAVKLDKTLSQYLKPLERTEFHYQGLFSSLEKLDENSSGVLRQRIYDSKNFNDHIKKQGLDFWLEKLNQNFEVQFSRVEP